MAIQVTIQTGARLHFGLLAVHPVQGREFGGVGVMLDQPGFRIVCQASHLDHVVGATASTAQRVRDFLARVRRAWPEPLPPVLIDVQQEIDSHGGMGSGTQLGLAVAVSVLSIAGIPQPSAFELAQLVGRGTRSAIGVYGFDLGGFLMEAGRRPQDCLSPLVSRLQFPESWRWVLVSPRNRKGLSGPAEQQTFQELPPMPEGLTGALCRLLLMDWWPALLAADFAATSAALWEYGQRVGEYFAPAQGGRFADRQMESLAHRLRGESIHGIAQTSWGPTIAILSESQTAAETLVELIRQFPEGNACLLRTVAALNCGARVETTDSCSAS